METRNLRKTRQGVVISNKMDKTETRPLSKTKRWRLVQIVEKAK